MTDTRLKQTIQLGEELSETWVGTRTGNIIKARTDHLKELVRFGDMNLASIQVLELLESCKAAGKD